MILTNCTVSNGDRQISASDPWWRHQMETFSALLAICAGRSPVPGEFSAKGQWRGALMFSLICVWINGWVNNREVGNLRQYHAQYDVTVMSHALREIWYGSIQRLKVNTCVDIYVTYSVSRQYLHSNITSEFSKFAIHWLQLYWKGNIRHSFDTNLLYQISFMTIECSALCT